jgi:Na+-transporting NADH:ubiquinone oxidoreductase subunit F
MTFLASGLLSISVSIIVFLILILVFVVLILIAKAKLVPSGNAKIIVNGEKEFENKIKDISAIMVYDARNQE